MRRWLVRVVVSAVLAGPACAASAVAQSPSPPPVQIRLVTAGVEPSFYTLEDFPSEGAFKVLADRHGFVWIGGNKGLHRYDGHHFATIDRDPSQADPLASRVVPDLVETRDALWIRSPGGVLQRLDTATGRLSTITVRTPDGATPRSYGWIGSDARDRLWMHTELGLLRFDPATSSVVVVKPSGTVEAGSSPKWDFSPDRQRLFGAENDDHRVFAVDVNALQVTSLLSIPEAFRAPITAIASDGSALWVAAGAHLWRADTANPTSLQRLDMPAPMPLRMSKMAVARDGIVWMASGDGTGLYRLDPKRLELANYRHNVSDPKSLPSDGIFSMATDRQDNLWLGLTYGASRLRLAQADAVQRFGLPGSKAKSVCALHERENQELMLTFCGGTLARFDVRTGQLTDLATDLNRILPGPDPPTMFTLMLVGDGAGGVWIPRTSHGMLHWHRDGTTSAFWPELGMQAAISAYRDDQGRLWVGRDNGVRVLEPGASAFRDVAARDAGGPFVFGAVGYIAPGPKGSLWLSTDHGLVHYQPDRGVAQRFVPEPGNPRSLSDNLVFNLHTDRRGDVWITTPSALNRMVVDAAGRISFRRYGLADGLPDITVKAILNDAQGALWIGTDRGVARWDARRDRFQSYPGTESIPINQGAALLGRDGGLYFGSDTGVWRIDPQRLSISEPAPLVLSSYEVGGKTTLNLRGRELQPLKANYDHGRISFRIANLGDARPMSYRLDGLDDRWQVMPDDPLVSYHQVPPGSYRFQVRQSDKQGRWQAPDLSIPLQIAPPPWRSPWAHAAYVLMAAIAIALLVRAYWLRRLRRLEHLRELQERDERLRMSMQASGDVLVEIDLTHARVAHVGESFFGYPIAGLPTRLDDYFAFIDSVVHPDDAHVVRELRESLTARRSSGSQLEYRLRTQEGAWTWVKLRGQFIQRVGKDGKADLFTGMLHDITEERHTRELRQKAHETQLRAETKGRVLAMMSHEIRTPMSGVVGAIELLDRTSLGRTHQKIVGICKDSVSVLLSVINDVLDFSKIESGKLQLERTALSPRRLVESVASAFGAQASKKGIDLDIQVDPSVPARILGDRVRLHQILNNLVNNAVKFTQRGGVCIALSMEAPDRLRLSVADTGIGMDETTLENLYQPYQQANAATARQFGGTGLGLTIARQLTELMGGRIDCASRVGEGTRFTVSIPVEAVSHAAQASPLTGVHVLALASAERRSVIAEPLRWLGASVEFVGNIEGLKAELRSEGPRRVDVVLIDKAGLAQEQLAAVKAEPSLSGIPVVMLRAWGASEAGSTGGVVVVEGNPLTRAELLRGMETALGRAASAPAVSSDEAEATDWPPSPALPGRSILLAEDNPSTREVLCQQLLLLGCQCDAVEDGEQAWLKIQAHPGRYDLLITDGNMPRLDGYRLAERIRQIEQQQSRPRLPILALTASADEGEEALCLAAGMDGYLAKPARMDDLMLKLNELLPQAVGYEPARLDPTLARLDLPPGLAGLLDIVRGDEAKLMRLLDIVIETTRSDLLAMGTAQQAGDRRAIASLAHRLKSTCIQVGEEAAWSALETLEKAARGGRVDDSHFDRLVDMAKTQVESTLKWVEQHRASSEEAIRSRRQ